ncbi:fungal-specific transcription factor domain-containing protein [Stachybotrys elegans]|uniref:Fungal-specific transcription factor domain-containing protein n=1 Tax=Stachybotrys elegans TaxID=80388 RepID=A0A8K0WUH7_9HYPO|nr:fungal-specific transcription factor domain-containing protein [Stachybotrys elegans]
MSAPEHRRKRVKIDIACDTCRAKKVRCDGVRPVCGYCYKKPSRRDGCRYITDDPSEKQDNAQIQPKSNEDAQSMPRVVGVPPPPPPPGPAFEILSHTAATFREVHGQTLEPIPNHHRPSLSSNSPAGSTPAKSLVDGPRGLMNPSLSSDNPSLTGVDSMTAVVDDDSNTQEFFGSSSAGSFTAQIKKAIDARLGYSADGPRAYSSPSGLANSTGGSAWPKNDLHYVLPPRRQVDSLMEQYWTYVDPLYPFLDKKSWIVTYNALFAGTGIDTDERTFVASLNVILALATQLVEDLQPAERDRLGNDYFQRARALLPLDPWHSNSVELIQHLLLTIQYLQSTNHPHQTWMLVGSAVRTAQSLGLHLPETTIGLEPRRQDLLRRLWYGCVLMDRIVSVTHGRPAMVSGQLSTAVPMHISTAPILNEGGWRHDDDVNPSFFFKSVRLYDIMHRIMIAFYGGRERNGGSRDSSQPPSSAGENSEAEGESLDTILQLDRSLTAWERDMPAHLQYDRLDTIDDPICRRQTVILRIRFLHARILLLRPTVARWCFRLSERDTRRDSLQTRLVEQSAQFCVSTAQNIISILLEYQPRDGTVGFLPSWWYRVYYLYSAATILIAARLRPRAFPTVDINQSWSQAMSVLQDHEHISPSARRCLAALQILSAKMMQFAPVDESPEQPHADGERVQHEDKTSQDDRLPHEQADGPRLFDNHSVFMANNGSSLADLEGTNFDFNVQDPSWFNDMHSAWELLQ